MRECGRAGDGCVSEGLGQPGDPQHLPRGVRGDVQRMVDDVPSRTERPVSPAACRLPARFQQRCRSIAASSRFSSAFSVFLAAFSHRWRCVAVLSTGSSAGSWGSLLPCAVRANAACRVELIWLGCFERAGLWQVPEGANINSRATVWKTETPLSSSQNKHITRDASSSVALCTTGVGSASAAPCPQG